MRLYKEKNLGPGLFASLHRHCLTLPLGGGYPLLLTLTLCVCPACALAKLPLRVLAHRAWQARVHVVGFVRVGANRALFAHSVLLVLAGVHKARARLTHATCLAAARHFVLVVPIGATTHGIVGLHAWRRHALQTHALGARLARLGGTHHVGESHTWGATDGRGVSGSELNRLCFLEHQIWKSSSLTRHIPCWALNSLFILSPSTTPILSITSLSGVTRVNLPRRKGAQAFGPKVLALRLSGLTQPSAGNFSVNYL